MIRHSGGPMMHILLVSPMASRSTWMFESIHNMGPTWSEGDSTADDDHRHCRRLWSDGGCWHLRAPAARSLYVQYRVRRGRWLGGARGAVLLGTTRALSTMAGAAVHDRRSSHCFGSKGQGILNLNQEHTKKKGFSTHLVELECQSD